MKGATFCNVFHNIYVPTDKNKHAAGTWRIRNKS